MAYGWGINEPVIKPLEEGGDNINQYALKIKNALDTLYVELRQDIVRATLAESIAATDINKIITPSTAYRTYYGTSEPSNLQGKNNDTYIKYGDVKEMYIKVSGSWQKIDAVPQPATLAEVNAGLLVTKYVTPQTMNQNNKSDLPGGYPRLDGDGLLPSEYAREGIQVWTTPGIYKWTCPEHVKVIIVSGCAGGGSGGGSSGNYIGGGGGSGGQALDYPISVTPGETYTITIGAGGAGIRGNVAGNAGEITSVGALLSLSGGAAGRVGFSGSSPGVVGDNGSGFANVGQDRTANGYGANGLWGVGGMVGSISAGKGSDGTGYGSAGGGSYASSYYSGNGAPGFLSIKWVK